MAIRILETAERKRDITLTKPAPALNLQKTILSGVNNMTEILKLRTPKKSISRTKYFRKKKNSQKNKSRKGKKRAKVLKFHFHPFTSSSKGSRSTTVAEKQE